MGDAQANKAATPDLNVDVAKVIGPGAIRNTSANDTNENMPNGADPQSGGFVDGVQGAKSDPLGYGDAK